MAAVPPDSDWFGVTLLFVLYGCLVAVMLILATNCTADPALRAICPPLPGRSSTL